jgi:hypothetical protein
MEKIEAFLLTDGRIILDEREARIAQAELNLREDIKDLLTFSFDESCDVSKENVVDAIMEDKDSYAEIFERYKKTINQSKQL